jgi:hypothetical protein
MKYIKNTFTEYTGGGCYVDFVTLSDGRVIGINNETIVLYESFEAFNTPTDDWIYLTQFSKPLPEIKE